MTILGAFGLHSVVDGVREGFFMFWATLWALVLGFGLSGAVQAFVSRGEMQRVLGDHRPPAVLRATGLGMVSSSCSYAAAAMARSLFQKGADFLSAMVFMFASTNLVIELGVVLLILMGWQFAVAEFLGGPIMIVLLVLVGSVAIGAGAIASARRHVRSASGAAADGSDAEDGDAALQRQPWSVKLRSKAGWSDAAGYAIGDVTMLRKELVIGYLVAGLLTIVVPAGVWHAAFLQGHGSWTSLENAVVGPLIAFVSFVCSVGNVPMAAALWHGGSRFGGVISFLFADLIAFPLVMIYRKLYGGAMALRLFFLFWGVMAVAGLAVEGIFALFGAIPVTRPSRIVPTTFAWDYTTFLNIVFIGVFGLLFWLHRNRERLGGGQAYATDPVCKMQVERASAPARASIGSTTHYFCSDGCRERFEAAPDRFVAR